MIVKYFLTFCLIICMYGRASASASAYIRSDSSVIAIDAGHGGVDGGTYVGDLLEKDLNLKMALKLRTLLEQKGYTVVMTRETDMSLDKLNHSSGSRHERDLKARVDIINASRAQIFISLHVNSFQRDPSVSGSLVLYNKERPRDRLMACYIQDALNKLTLGGKPRKKHAPLPGRYYLLGYAAVPGVIVEAAYISNQRERELLKSEEVLDSLAQAIANGTVGFLDSE